MGITQRSSLLACLLAAVAALTACASSGPVVVSSPGGTRSVTVGQEVVVRLPATTTNREWRLAEFDSRKLPVTTRPRIEGEGADAEWVSRFIARNPGRANIEYVRTAIGPGASGSIGERRRFTFNVRQ